MSGRGTQRFWLCCVLVCALSVWKVVAESGAPWKEDVFHDALEPVVRADELPAPYGLLLVVGRVDGTSARLLYEGDPTSPLTARQANYDVKVWAWQPEWGVSGEHAVPAVGMRGEAEWTTTVVPVAEPRVLTLDSLTPDTHYVVRFVPHGAYGDLPHDATHEVQFSTMDPLSTKPLRIVAVACDRYFEDRDSTLLTRLAAQARTPRAFDVVVHMGDQIYADWLLEPLANATFDEVLQEFRRVYRLGWTRPEMKAILRRGSHLMIPDDHDVTNALSEECWRDHRVFVEAAQRAFYEYQLQLRQDIPPRDPNRVQVPLAEAKSSTLDVHDFLVLRRTGFALVDMRWQRSFNFDAEAPFLGRHQLVAIEDTLSRWEDSGDVDRLAVFSSVPVLYQGLWPAEIADSFENEKYSTADEHEDETLRLLRALRDRFSGTKLLMAGDLHMFLDSSICDTTTPGSCMRQIISSGLTASASTMRALTLILYSMLTLRLWPSTLAEFDATFQDIFLSQNYLVVCAACPEEDVRHQWSGREGTPASGFAWHSERLALSASHRLWHTLHDHSASLLSCVAALLLLWTASAVCCCCCGYRCACRKRKRKQE